MNHATLHSRACAAITPDIAAAFQRDGARCLRGWTTSPPFPGLADELPAGAPMDHPLFPLLVKAD